MKSLPGRCGKPRKLSAFANFMRQVSNLLSQPAVTANKSPSATGSGICCQSATRTSPASILCSFTSTERPAFGPAEKVSLPRVNQVRLHSIN